MGTALVLAEASTEHGSILQPIHLSYN